VEIDAVQEQVGKLVTEWEDNGSAIVEGADLRLVRQLELLQRFIGEPDEWFESNVAVPMRRIQRWLRTKLYAE
jgi:hypothetical protein